MITINSVDVELGVKRVGGNLRVYLKLLRAFASGLEIDDTPMETAFSQENAEKSELKMHAIKGTAGNLGATALYNAICEFEITQRAGAPDRTLYENIWLRMKETKENILNATDT